MQKLMEKMGLDICRSSFNPQVVVLYDNFESGKIADRDTPNPEIWV